MLRPGLAGADVLGGDQAGVAVVGQQVVGLAKPVADVVRGTADFGVLAADGGYLLRRLLLQDEPASEVRRVADAGVEPRPRRGDGVGGLEVGVEVIQRQVGASVAEFVGGELSGEHHRDLRDLDRERPQVDAVELLGGHEAQTHRLTPAGLAAAQQPLLV